MSKNNNQIKYAKEKRHFLNALKIFASRLPEIITLNNKWTVRGFIDIFKNIYTISTDTKIISKILELHLFPQFMLFASHIGYTLELAAKQNWYPDLSFISKINPDIKFAVALKTTYRNEKNPNFCNGFTLGSHGEYFINRESSKNIQYPYNQYRGHFCLGIIYSRENLNKLGDTKIYNINEINNIPAVIKDFIFFAEEKWKIAGDRSGSGNTANIGSINYINDILNGDGVFAKAGEKFFDDYWINFGKINIQDKNGKLKKLSSFAEYLRYRGLPESLNNIKRHKESEGRDE